MESYISNHSHASTKFQIIPTATIHAKISPPNFNCSDDGEENSKWDNFVDSIRSKLTVKQVVDGVRAGGSLSFDYLLLIVTAE